MADNVDIIVQDTINEIVVNAAVVVETIDINVQVAVDEVTIIANPNDYIINVNRIIGEQVQSDWNVTDDQAPDYIKNKPIIPSIEGLATVVYVDQQDALKVNKVVGKGLSTNDFTDILKTKLDGIQDGAEVNVNADWDATSGDAEILNKPTIPAAVTKTSDLTNDGADGVNPFITLNDIPADGLTSVGLTMPAAFSVANSPLTSDGTIEVTAAGTSAQYIRGDGQLATLPSGGGGGASVFYYLNGSIAASVATYKQLSNTAVIGSGTDFAITGNGLITQFLTDVGNPNRLQIPSGAWNFEMFFSMSSSGGTPKFYVELLKYNGATFTTIADNSAAPETISGGTSIDLYLSSLAVPETTLLLTDRLAIRVYIVNNSGGRTATLHTEDNHLCQITTTFASGISAINGLNSNNQYLSVGTSGTDFNINSVSETHTFNLPTASATNRGALSTTDWSAFNAKQNALTNPITGTGTTNYLPKFTGTSALGNSLIFDNGTNVGIGTAAPSFKVQVETSVNGADGIYARNTNTGASAFGIVTASSMVGNLDLKAHSAAHGAWPNTSMLQSGSGFTGGLVLQQQGANPISFWTNSNERMRINAAGNVGIGTTAPAAKLDIVDTTLSGSGALAGSVLKLAQTWNTTGNPTAIFANITNTASGGSSKIMDLQIGTVSQLALFKDGRLQLNNGTINAVGNSLNFRSALGGGASYVIDVQSYNTLNGTNNEQGFGMFSGTYAPTTLSGVPSFNALKLSPTINQTGTANGVTRGLYINPTLTSAANFRAVELSNNTGFGIFQSGTAVNSFAGNVGIGTTAPTSKLQVVGLVDYATNALAIAGGLTVGAFYHTAGVVKVVI